jgi:hypothetical protein
MGAMEEDIILFILYFHNALPGLVRQTGKAIKLCACRQNNMNFSQ